MIQTKQTRMAVILIAAALLLLTLLAVIVRKNGILKPVETTPEPFVYTSLGDSIAAGFALPGYDQPGQCVPDSFVDQLSRAMAADEIYQYAVPGDRTDDLLTVLEREDVQEQIKRSKVITVSIGSNDIMVPGLQLLYQTLGVDSPEGMMQLLTDPKVSGFLKIKYWVDMAALLRSDKLADQLDLGVRSYEANFERILDRLHTLNDKAEIYVLNYYNPFADLSVAGVMDFGSFVQTFLDRMNHSLAVHPQNGKGFYLVDVSSMPSSLTNVELNLQAFRFNLDPHPNLQGHEWMAQQLIASYNEHHPVS